jgi:hypothetical protein
MHALFCMLCVSHQPHFAKRHFGHHTVFVGDLRLSDFKQVLTRAGIEVRYVDGCDSNNLGWIRGRTLGL